MKKKKKKKTLVIRRQEQCFFFFFISKILRNLSKKKSKINRIFTRIRKTSKNFPISLSKIAKFRQNKNTGQEVDVGGGDEITGRISSDQSM